MATGQEIVNLAATRLGQIYKLGSLAPKNDANFRGPWDCAEFCSWLVFQISGRLYGCNTSDGDPAKADAYTGYWRDDAKKRGQIISVAEAIRTPGAFLLRVPTTVGHIVVSDGNGGTLEAMGTAYGTRRGGTSGRVWDFGILVPWISYNGKMVDGSPSAPIPTSSPLRQEQNPPSENILILRRSDTTLPNDRVEALQRALAEKKFDPGPFDGLFGPLTEGAVFDFQEDAKLTVDGEVGPETGLALNLPYWKTGDSIPV
jgi:N-acetylmuramoyl-L-alanine amidase